MSRVVTAVSPGSLLASGVALGLGTMAYEAAADYEIGVQVQAHDADLDAIAALGSTGIVVRTGSGSAAARTITGTANQVNVSNGSGVSGNPTLSLPQSVHSGATPTFAGLSLSSPLTVANGGTGLASGTSGGIPYFNAPNTMASSAALGSTQVVLGGGAGGAPNTSATIAFDGNSLNIGSPTAALTSAARLRLSEPNTIVFAGENINASGSAAGAFAGLYSNDGAAMASGDRLGGFLLGGSISGSALVNAALIAAFATDTWSSGVQTGARLDFELVPNGSTSRTAKMRLLGSGRLSIGGTIFDPTATLHLAAGTTSASTAPLKFTTGTSMTSAEAGAMEYTTDDLFFTIATSTARKRLLMADPVGGLTSGRLPVVTTNGRLTDSANATCDISGNMTLAASLGVGSQITAGQAAAISTAMLGVQQSSNTISHGILIRNSGQTSSGRIYQTTGDALSINSGGAGAGVMLLNEGGGKVQYPSIGTTASAANAYIDNSDNNTLLRSTSSLDFKRILGPLTLEEAGDLIDLAEPIRYQSRSSRDNPLTEHVGFAAEQIAKIDDRFVTRRLDSAPDWVQYSQFVAPLALVAKDLRARMDRVERALNLQ